ncbi:MAG: hypothetical protein KC983_04745 [Phycisphaerales bacterium]|nr:hypothetical protein [Phycisphaerales bacterium]
MKYAHSVCAIAMLACAGSAQAQFNHRNASMTVNFYNQTGPSLTDARYQALIGQLDPNMIVITGQPNAPYVVTLRDAKKSDDHGHALAYVPSGQIVGVLDSEGTEAILVPPLTFSEGEQFTLSAMVFDPSFAGGFRPTGKTDVTVVRTMSATIGVIMPIGSMADARAFVTAKGRNWVSVGNIVYQIDSRTEWAQDDISGLDDINIGDWLVVDGEFNSSGGFRAKEINVEDTEANARLGARVQSIGPGGIAMMDVSIYISDDTEIVDYRSGTPMTMDDIMIGMPVEAYISTAGQFPHVVRLELNSPMEIEAEPEDEPEKEDMENEIQWPPPSFCS